MNKVNLFGLSFNNFNFEDLEEYIDNTITKAESKYIVTCNVDHLVQLKHDIEFVRVYEAADVIIADGTPIVWSSKFLKKQLKEKLSGSDIIPKLGSHFEKKGYKIFFLGAKEGVAKKAKENLEIIYPSIKIVGCYSPPMGFENSSKENNYIIDMLKKEKPDILFVGLGAPKQEKWIYNNYLDYGVPISIGVGASIDFVAGNIKRAPVIFQKAGLEWLWRLCSEPRRLWRRYLLQDSKFLKILYDEVKNNST